MHPPFLGGLTASTSVGPGAGVAHAEKSGYDDGHELGRRKGHELGRELGIHRGRVDALIAVYDAHPQSCSDRYECRVRTLVFGLLTARPARLVAGCARPCLHLGQHLRESLCETHSTKKVSTRSIGRVRSCVWWMHGLLEAGHVLHQPHQAVGLRTLVFERDTTNFPPGCPSSSLASSSTPRARPGRT